MLKRRKASFEQLFKENKEEIMKDKVQLEIIEKRLEKKAELANKVKK
ncbi:FbpB family small basic protein [Bacillus sp. JJ1503]